MIAPLPPLALDGVAWPHRAASTLVQAGHLRWHVQRMGRGPVALLIHGTGASTHSWRRLMPVLARHYSVVAMDLPGHAFTGTPPARQMSLPGMAQAVVALVQALALDVELVVGHSAGAAIGARAVLDGALAPRALVAINGAFLPLAGVPGVLFPPVARLMAATPLAAQLFARRRWDRAAVERLIRGTGSTLDDEGLALYGALVRDPRHAAGALAMMARWYLRPLAHDLARRRTPHAMIVGADDRAVPPADAQRVRRLLPAGLACSVSVLPRAGHLVHEERADEVAGRVLEAGAPRPLDAQSPSGPGATYGSPPTPRGAISARQPLRRQSSG
jgi:magnesium chelatase accessory protein